MIHDTVDPQSSTPSSISVGARLKQERLKQNIELEAIASKTHLHLKHLIAIEADDLAALPEPIYVRSFLRKYAQCLVLSDAAREEILGGHESNISTRSNSKKLRSPLLLQTGLPKRIQYGLYGLFVFIVGGSLVYLNNANFSGEPAAQTPVSESVANSQ